MVTRVTTVVFFVSHCPSHLMPVQLSNRSRSDAPPLPLPDVPYDNFTLVCLAGEVAAVRGGLQAEDSHGLVGVSPPVDRDEEGRPKVVRRWGGGVAVHVHPIGVDVKVGGGEAGRDDIGLRDERSEEMRGCFRLVRGFGSDSGAFT